jgi:hypothetical protein
MEHPVPRPNIINALRWGTDAAFAMLAGMQLDVFTPLQSSPLTAEQLAVEVGRGAYRWLTGETAVCTMPAASGDATPICCDHACAPPTKTGQGIGQGHGATPSDAV